MSDGTPTPKPKSSTEPVSRRDFLEQGARYGLTVVARPQVERARAILSPYLRPLRLGIAAFLGLVVGLQASGLWQGFLLWRNREQFGERDA